MSLLLLTLDAHFRSRDDLFLLLIYLHTPIYMLHQVEEHTGDRFREFVNQLCFTASKLSQHRRTGDQSAGSLGSLPSSPCMRLCSSPLAGDCRRFTWLR